MTKHYFNILKYQFIIFDNGIYLFINVPFHIYYQITQNLILDGKSNIIIKSTLKECEKLSIICIHKKFRIIIIENFYRYDLMV